MGACASALLRFLGMLVATLVVVAYSAGVAWAEPSAAVAAPAACDSPEVASLLTPEEQQQMLDLHNALRAKYGSSPLTWDATAASCAQDWANQRAAGEQQTHRSPNRFGENVFGNWSCCDPASFTSTPADAMGFWGGEEPNYDVATNSCNAGTVCGHFTQVVWSTTTRLGCGKAIVPDTPQPGATSAHWVCNYDPPGNNGARPFDPALVPGAAPTATEPPTEPQAETNPPAVPPPTENQPDGDPSPPADQQGGGDNPPADDGGNAAPQDNGDTQPDGG